MYLHSVTIACPFFYLFFQNILRKDSCALIFLSIIYEAFGKEKKIFRDTQYMSKLAEFVLRCTAGGRCYVKKSLLLFIVACLVHVCWQDANST